MQKLNKKYASVAQWIERRFPKQEAKTCGIIFYIFR